MKKLVIILSFSLFSGNQVPSNKEANKVDKEKMPFQPYKLDKNMQPLNTVDDSIMRSFIAAAHEFEKDTIDKYPLTFADAKTIKNITRPHRTYIQNPKYPIENLIGVWGGDTAKEPVSEFQVDAKIFDVAEYEGNGNMPYILFKDSLIVFYNDFARIGRVLNSTPDSLTIRWSDETFDHLYLRWK